MPNQNNTSAHDKHPVPEFHNDHFRRKVCLCWAALKAHSWTFLDTCSPLLQQPRFRDIRLVWAKKPVFFCVCMFVFVYVCVCVWVSVYVCVYVCMHACKVSCIWVYQARKLKRLLTVFDKIKCKFWSSQKRQSCMEKRLNQQPFVSQNAWINCLSISGRINSNVFCFSKYVFMHICKLMQT